MSVEEKDDGGRASPKRAAIGARVVSVLSKDSAVQHVGTDMVQMFACPDFLSMDECDGLRSDEHTSEPQSLMRTSYALFCLKKNTNYNNTYHTSNKTSKKTNTTHISQY